MRRTKLAALWALSLLCLLPACGDDDGGDSAFPGTSGANAGTSAPEAQSGGILTMATYIPTSSLDPLISPGFGVAGGIELLAVYDSLIRWDPQTAAYEMRTAESLAPNDDYTSWTLTLKDGITFTDGTPYDAEAVVFNLQRHWVGNPGAPPCHIVRACPANTTGTNLYMTKVAGITAVDDLTVRIDLNKPWAAFPFVLASEAGMIASPTAILAACPDDPEASARDCEYGRNPVGAGPFKVTSFNVGETVNLERNEGYYRDGPLLDGLRFLTYGDGGGDQTLEALKGGDVDVAFLRSATATAGARAAGLEMYSAIQHGGSILWLNTAAGSGTERTDVRQAIAAAIDPDQVDDRVNDGQGLPGSDLFAEGFRLDPDVPGPAFEPDKAKQLVRAAKADGWNGTVRLFCASHDAEIALAVQTMLQAAGMTVDADTQFDTRGLINQVNVLKDFDIACAGTPITQDDLGLHAGIDGMLRSDSPRNKVSYASPEMDAALDELMIAADADAKAAALEKIATLYGEDLPMLVLGAVEEAVAWDGDKVHGIYATQSTEVFFDKAWLAS